ncbi:MAG: glycosyl transferase family 1, partial [Candidatus Bathyarchaeota archaeon]|nr:glycosyl transferase family 1 [Candidatus Bathyarchaeota archaeon]
MSEVSLGTLSLDSYREIIGETEIRAIQNLAKQLKGKSVVHVNSTAFGGGVSEMLRRIVPLMRDVGLDAHWKVIKGEMEFFDVTKSFHNALQGMQMPLSAQMKQIYLNYNKLNAESLDLDYDYVVIHDPQPLALIDYQTKKNGKWIWRCHIDLSQPNMQFWRFMEPSLEKYDAYIFTAKQYVKSPLEKRNVALITPSIDPLSNKCKPLPESQVFSVLERYNINPEHPLLNQVARFDPWKDPLGVIDV